MAGRLGMLGPVSARGDKLAGAGPRVLVTHPYKPNRRPRPAEPTRVRAGLHQDFVPAQFSVLKRIGPNALPYEPRPRRSIQLPLPVRKDAVSRGTSVLDQSQRTLDRKARRWTKRADAAEGTRNAGLVGATVGGAALLAARRKGVSPALRGRLDNVGIGSAVVGGAAELYGEAARSRADHYRTAAAAHRVGLTGSSR